MVAREGLDKSGKLLIYLRKSYLHIFVTRTVTRLALSVAFVPQARATPKTNLRLWHNYNTSIDAQEQIKAAQTIPLYFRGSATNLERVLEDEIEEKVEALLDQFPVVAVGGRPLVEKTSLAHKIAAKRNATYFDLESEECQNNLSDPHVFFPKNGNRLIIFDKIHRASGLLHYLQEEVDSGDRSGPGQFLLVGSPLVTRTKLWEGGLAGRIAYFEMSPLSVQDVEEENVRKLWLRGSLPNSYFAETDEDSYAWRRKDVLHAIVRNLKNRVPEITGDTAFRILRACAFHHGGNLIEEQIFSKYSVPLDRKLIRNCIGFLIEEFQFIRELCPITLYGDKEPFLEPKMYLRDTGLLFAIRSYVDELAFSDTLLADASWKGFVIENVLQACPEETEARYYQGETGAETDLVLRLPNGGTIAIKAQRHPDKKALSGFRRAVVELYPMKSFVVCETSGEPPPYKHFEIVTVRELSKLLLQEYASAGEAGQQPLVADSHTTKKKE